MLCVGSFQDDLKSIWACIVSSKELPNQIHSKPRSPKWTFLGTQTSMTLRAFFTHHHYHRWMICVFPSNVRKMAFLKLTPDASKSTSYFLMITSMASQLRSPKLDGCFFFHSPRLGVFWSPSCTACQEGKQCSLPILFFSTKDPKFRKGWVAAVGRKAFSNWWII